MTKQQQIAEILNIEEDVVVDLCLSYMLYLVSMEGNQAHNQWLVRRFCGSSNSV